LTYYHIKLEIIATDEPIHILGYPSEFSQVILNLLNNAKDVLIERDIEHPRIVVESKFVEDEVIISVLDNGGGVEEEIMAEIFDIYFSTKMNKGGTGLGLYMSKLIIETKLLGKITVSNSKDGAKFSIILKYKSKK
jgi:signal transduction histidine kinase